MAKNTTPEFSKEIMTKWTWTVSQMAAYFGEQITSSCENPKGKAKGMEYSVCFDAEIWDFNTPENEPAKKTIHPVLWLNIDEKGQIYAEMTDWMCDHDLFYKVIGYLIYHKIKLKTPGLNDDDL